MALILNGTTGVSNVQSGVVQPEDLTGNQTGLAPIYGCRAWVNFDGTRNVTDTGASTIGQPVKIRASGNVTSITKNAVGDYTVNFTIAMPDTNYSVCTTFGNTAQATTYGAESIATKIYTVSSLQMVHNRADVSVQDIPIANVAIFR